MSVGLKNVLPWHHKGQVTGQPSLPMSKRPLWGRPAQGEFTASSHGKGDPVNMYLHGTLEQVRASFVRAGWTEPKANNLRNNAEYVEAAADQVILEKGEHLPEARVPSQVRQTVQTMPVSVMTLNGRPPAAAFELDNDPLHGRHHLRIYDTGTKDGAGRIVWAVAVVRDIGIDFEPKRPEQGFLGHAVEKDTAAERDRVVTQLEGTGMVKSSEKFDVAYGEPGEPGTYSGDGKAVDLVLGKPGR